MSDRLLTTEDLAKILPFSEETVRRWAREDLIPGAVKVGLEWRFPASVVVEWISSGAAQRLKEQVEEHLSARSKDIKGRVENLTFADSILARLLGSAEAEKRKKRPGR